MAWCRLLSRLASRAGTSGAPDSSSIFICRVNRIMIARGHGDLPLELGCPLPAGLADGSGLLVHAQDDQPLLAAAR